MHEQEFKARDKTVKKMSREGLTEENLHSKKAVRISPGEKEGLIGAGVPEDTFEIRSGRSHREIGEEVEPGKQSRRKAYAAAYEKPDSGTGGLEESSDTVKEAERLENETIPDTPRGMTEHSARMGKIQGKSSAKNYVEAAAETRHKRKKKQVYAKAEESKQETKKRESETRNENSRPQGEQPDKEPSGGGSRAAAKEKSKRNRVYQEQKKKSTRISFADEENGMVHGAGMGIAKKAASAAKTSAETYLHGKGHEVEKENAALEGTHRAEIMAEKALRHAMHKRGRRMQKRSPRLRETLEGATANGPLQFEAAAEAGKAAGKHAAETEQVKKGAIRRFWQKQKYKKAYQAAKTGERATAETIHITQTVFTKAKRAAAAVVGRNKGILAGLVIMVLLFVLMATSLSSCTASMQGVTSSIAGTTYVSTDEDIYAVENAYRALEQELNDQINSAESRHPGYDEYRYQVDEISHNPYHLISYFTAKYGEFTYAQVVDEVEEIFRQQYSITTESTQDTVTETKMVRVGESLGQVVTSGYCNCTICCGVWSGGPTASGVYPTASHTLAVDASNPFVPMGTKVVMNGVEYVVEDTGPLGPLGVQFDVYYGDHATAFAHGHKTWEAYIADDNGDQEVEVTSTKEVNRLDTTATNHNLDTVLRSRMDENEEKRYDLYNTTFGNRDYLFDVNTLPGGGSDGFGYDIPAEALTDQKFANMIREAEKYLGYPYVWGGASPSTSFDCSGFVSWVINNCGNGWNVGRQTAEGLRGNCSYVSPEQAKPGDLIFFQGTYNTAGASHVGIYVGDNMMIHCGKPIQYASITSPYWQQHFMAFGRIH